MVSYLLCGTYNISNASPVGVCNFVIAQIENSINDSAAVGELNRQRTEQRNHPSWKQSQSCGSNATIHPDFKKIIDAYNNDLNKCKDWANSWMVTAMNRCSVGMMPNKQLAFVMCRGDAWRAAKNKSVGVPPCQSTSAGACLFSSYDWDVNGMVHGCFNSPESACKPAGRGPRGEQSTAAWGKNCKCRVEWNPSSTGREGAVDERGRPCTNFINR